MKKIVALVLVLLVVYLLGYWPERQKRKAAESNLAQLRTLASLCRLQGELLTVIDDAENKNYGNAQSNSGVFFDDIRAQIDKSPSAPYRPSLETILARRDAITAGLSRTDPSALVPLRQSLNEIRQISQKLPPP